MTAIVIPFETQGTELCCCKGVSQDKHEGILGTPAMLLDKVHWVGEELASGVRHGGIEMKQTPSLLCWCSGG